MLEKQIEWVDINSLKPNPKNPNEHSKEQIERLSDIIKYQGWRHPIIVSELSGFIVAGHGRLEAAKQLKLDKVPVQRQSFDSAEQEFAFLVSDNAIALWAELSLPDIKLELEKYSDFNVDLLGIKDFALDLDKGQSDEDEVPEAPKIPKTKMGDLYLLGEHRLLCGDSTDASQVAKLMNNEKADMLCWESIFVSVLAQP